MFRVYANIKTANTKVNCIKFVFKKIILLLELLKYKT